jgi:hypothetical protein
MEGEVMDALPNPIEIVVITTDDGAMLYTDLCARIRQLPDSGMIKIFRLIERDHGNTPRLSISTYDLQSEVVSRIKEIASDLRIQKVEVCSPVVPAEYDPSTVGCGTTLVVLGLIIAAAAATAAVLH